jgi:predicted RNase H-like nuclease
VSEPVSKSNRGPIRVLGVDACKKGWIGITNDLRGYFAVTIADLLAGVCRDGTPEVTAIDIPIGLPITGPRQADALARKLVGRRASSVFSTPVRAALGASTHADASAISVKATGKGLSQQAFALGKKILEVDQWAHTSAHRVIEIHPEVSFAVMKGAPLRHPKSTWAGWTERRALLADGGLIVPDDLGIAGEMAGTDDVLDAAAAAWTARRFLNHVAVSYPPIAESFGDGHQAAIWA